MMLLDQHFGHEYVFMSRYRISIGTRGSDAALQYFPGAPLLLPGIR
jgi:hypothetical protein